ncbi:MAG: Ig-like domain-containing protein [Eubacterium sp.]|nr:Ig-like domain-containing protein [Eubacterium sp.]
MKFMKRSFALLLAFVMIFTIIPVNTVSAAVKLNKTTASICAGETLKLKLKGASKVKWKSTDTSVATVTSKGKVKGISAGSAVIKAVDKSTKKVYKCVLTVKTEDGLLSFGYTEDVFEFYFGYFYILTKRVKGATYYMDGELWATTTTGNRATEENKYCYVVKSLTDFGFAYGETHTLTIEKEGYETYTQTFTLSPPDVTGIFVENINIKIEKESFHFPKNAILNLNPNLYESELVIELDGTEVTPIHRSVNGDGHTFIRLDVSDLASGTHTVSVTCEEYGTESKTFEIE